MSVPNGDSSAAARQAAAPIAPFLKGIGIATWQSSGDENSNWTKFSRKRFPFAHFGVPACGGGYDIKHTCNFWERYEEDIALTAKLGCNSFRFSFEWSRIEPKRGQIDESAIQRFHAIIDSCEKHNLEPCVTIHHFVHPTWFDELGGFEKSENIPIAVEFAKLVFSRFGQRVRLWATLNEPSCYSFLGYIAGMGPPGWIMRPTLGGRVLLNLLRTHVAMYKAIKPMPGGERAQIGLVHHMIRFEPYHENILYWPAKFFARWFTEWWAIDIVDEWFKTGTFRWSVPVSGEVIYYKDEKPPCDWIGINYYSRPVISMFLQPSKRPGEIMTDMSYPLVPDGLFKALKQASAYGIPMYVTETGVADKTDKFRAAGIDAYFKAVLRAVAEGLDVRGFFYWTLVDNFEWSQGFRMKFGVYAYEPDGSKDRVLKEGGKALMALYRNMPSEMQEVKRYAQRAQEKQDAADLGTAKELDHQKKAGRPPKEAEKLAAEQEARKAQTGIYAMAD